MKIAYCSDLHLDFDAKGIDLTASDADVLVIAGDFCEVRLLNASDTSSLIGKRDAILAMLNAACDYYKAVIMVAGNHEPYRTSINTAYHFLMEQLLAHRENFHFLQNTTVVVAGIKFAGCTLWSDIPPTSEYLIQNNMNDYRLITLKTSSGYRKLRVADTVTFHKESVSFLQENSDADVVITHHAPSTRSISDEYIGHPLNQAYYTDLDYLLPNHKLWIHGHMHHLIDYTLHGCNVVANPRGYSGHEAIANSFKLRTKTI